MPGAGRGRPLRLPLVTLPCPARPPSCKMAAAESSDSEEEDLVSYGSALQPLQEGKGPPGGRCVCSSCVPLSMRCGERPRAVWPEGPGHPQRPERCGPFLRGAVACGRSAAQSRAASLPAAAVGPFLTAVLSCEGMWPSTGPGSGVRKGLRGSAPACGCGCDIPGLWLGGAGCWSLLLPFPSASQKIKVQFKYNSSGVRSYADLTARCLH